MELQCNPVQELSKDPWTSWEVPGLSELEGFGCEVPDGKGPLSVVHEMRHPTEVNRVAPCPHRPQIISTRAANGSVLLFDCKSGTEASAEGVAISDPTAVLFPEGAEAVDGFALAWSRMDRHLLASGGNDGLLVVWDAEASAKARSSSTPVVKLQAHEGALCDASYSSFAPSLLATVGDKDRLLCLWDIRCSTEGSSTSIVTAAKPHMKVVASSDEVLTVDWSYKNEWQLATAGKEHLVKVWDTRALREPVSSLRGHEKDIIALRWAPFREDLLATSAEDSKVIIWDLQSKAGEAQAAEPGEGTDQDALELLFTHGGHDGGEHVSDFSWGPDDFLMCSVSSDNGMQVWQPSTVFYLDESDDENGAGEPDLKRQRHGE